MKASLGYMFPPYDSHGLFQWELLYTVIQRGSVYRIDVLFPLHDCGYNIPCSVNFFSHFFSGDILYIICIYIYIYIYMLCKKTVP